MNTPLHPADWPAPGPIDVALHDLPHASAETEWWYLNAHLWTDDGIELSVFAAFFRIARRRNAASGEVEYAHSLTWAVSAPARKKYWAESWVDPDAPAIGLEQLDRGRGTSDARINRAMREVLEKGNVPLPDRMFAQPCFVSTQRLELEFDDHRLTRLEDGSYQLRCFSDVHKAGFELRFVPQKAPVRHGDDGVVRGARGEDMFYYFIPRCAVTGSVTLDGVPRNASGSGWYDHEFGGRRSGGVSASGGDARTADAGAPPAEPQRDTDVAWNWLAAQLDDGSELTAYTMVQPDENKTLGERIVAIAPDGTRRESTSLTLAPTSMWRSTRTFFDYPRTWVWQCEALGVDLTVTADIDDQELLTVLSYPSFWEGRCRVEGRVGGREVRGLTSSARWARRSASRCSSTCPPTRPGSRPAT
jgi:predicted secreted hydrolase